MCVCVYIYIYIYGLESTPNIAINDLILSLNLEGIYSNYKII